MTIDPTHDDDAIFDDEAYAQDMRDYWEWASRQPDAADDLADLAEDEAIARMEAEGIATAERDYTGAHSR